MKKVSFFASKKMIIGQVPDEMFGSFVEHLGRAIYTGIYEPGHPKADDDGFREDVIERIRELNISIVRYPGGNFVSGYNWLDGIGPKDKRPRRLDLAWRTVESNQFGTDEFMKWAKKAGVEPMMVVNLGTGTPQEAGFLLEYCNHPEGTYYSDLRKQFGSKEPYKVKYWCLGNEMDGGWQICHLNAEDYSKKALETAKIMKWIDPSIRLVAVGSSSSDMPTYPDWDRIILEYLYDHVDYLSMHKYYFYDGKNELDFLASFHEMDQFIYTIKCTADYVKAKKRSRKTIYISFDEWNIWNPNSFTLEDWKEAPAILEEVYTVRDAIAFGGLLITLLNNCDRVKIAALAQLVNVIAPIRTQKGGGVIKQTIFYPFQLTSNFGRGTALRVFSDVETVKTRHGDTPIVYPAVIYNEADSTINIFVINILDNEIDFNLELHWFGKIQALEHQVLDGELNAQNSFDNPERVKVRKVDVPYIKNQMLVTKLPPLSWNMIRLKEIVNE